LRRCFVHDNSNIRQITFADRKYVLQSWLFDYRESPEMGMMPNLSSDDYFGYQHKLIEDILPRAAKAGSAYLCCEPGKDHLFRGWLVAEPYQDLPVVHYMKVKKGAQQQGVATALLERFFEDFNYAKGLCNVAYTHSAKDIARNKNLQRWVKDWSGVYVPWLKYTLAEPGWEA
jgi:GNAT superfamily N-acetyltransferase